ncbi:HOG (high osmolarity glycerol) pathway protein [Madurella fahalii]|uniref:HOG (High osmolarity glycerol) pathway protein n=1 Tax=Madurella fahalii TaxID=1157608 RepID=A0ABQ0FZX1_9PEZI
MTAIMSPSSSPATSPPAISPPAANSAHPALPPLITSPPARRSTLPRPMSHASKNRLSQYSTTSSMPSRSRPPSHIFPILPSSLPYTLVRDFAYPLSHPMHYGPPPEPSRPPSGMTTPASEQRRLSDPPTSWDSRTSWDSHSWGSGASGRPADLPSIQFADGPPWSEDEDLHSPVVSSRHRKHKSSGGAYGRSRAGRDAQPGSMLNAENYDRERGYYAGTSGDGSERYYVNQGDEANGPGGEYVTYPPDQARHGGNAYQLASQQPRQYEPGGYGSDDSSTCSSPGYHNTDESRYSRDYQFTITSPDEEMHGKAVALFDFERENDSELPLVEGQIIWVSYRYGQGWLVAEDPKTQESGLVPEEYVRLLRDIEGGMTSLTGHINTGGDTASPASPSTTNDVGTPTQAEHSASIQFPHSPALTTNSNASSSAATNNTATSTAAASTSMANGYHQPIVSTFSTSSKDLDPYPQHLLGTQAGQPPPQVVHYHGQRGGSQANTPTLAIHQGLGFGAAAATGGGGSSRRASQDTTGLAAAKKGGEGAAGVGVGGLETLPDVKMEKEPEVAEEGSGAERKRESR